MTLLQPRFRFSQPQLLTLSCILSKNGQTYSKNRAMQAPQDFLSMLDHLSTLCMKRLMALSCL